MSFAERLRISRKETGLSQEEFAEELNVSRQSITKWEAGSTYPEVKTLILLASRLGKDLDWLLYDELSDTQTESFLLRLLSILDGYELREAVLTEHFKGTKTYTFHNRRVFLILRGTDLPTNEKRESISEVSLEELEELFPWIKNLRKPYPATSGS